MADFAYNIDFTGRDSLSAVIAGLHAHMAALDAEADKVKAKLQGFASGSSRSTNAMAKSVEALTANLAALKSQLEGVNAGLNQTQANAGGVTTSFGQMAGAMMAFREVDKVLEAIGSGLARAREESERLAEANLKLRDSMRRAGQSPGPRGAG